MREYEATAEEEEEEVEKEKEGGGKAKGFSRGMREAIKEQEETLLVHAPRERK